MAVAITLPPNLALKNYNLTWGGDNHTITSTWEVPSALTDENNNRRATYFHEHLIFYTSDRVHGDVDIDEDYNVDITTGSYNLASRWDTARDNFYPLSDLKLEGVGSWIETWNTKGIGPGCYNGVFDFVPPPAPTIDEITFNTADGHCNTTVKAVDGSSSVVEGSTRYSYPELYDIYYRITVKTRTGETIVASEGASTSTEFNLTYDASDYQNLEHNEFIMVTVEATARGYAGDSNTTSRSYCIAYPAKPTITGTKVSAKDSSGKLTVGIRTNESSEHPVDKITLEYMANTRFETASSITGSWTDAGITDDGDCTALAMPVENLIPDRGRFTWIRVKATHAHEGLLYRYSDYVRLTDLETPPADLSEDGAVILSAVSGEEGTSAVVLIGWDRSGEDDSIGTELTWSDEEDTWKSTKDPDHHEFEWSDGSITYEGVTYHGSAEITVKGLKEGEKYYIRARRYYEGDTRSYGRYSNTATVVTSEKPAGVVARCNGYVPDGQPVSVYWTFSGNGIQKEWQIVKTNGTVVASGEGSIGSTQISANRLKALAVNNTLSFTVQVSTGSGFVSSDELSVTILHKPTLTLTVPSSITAQPFTFTAASERPCDLIVNITAMGVSGQSPEGIKTQISGDTIYSDVISPAWTNGSATIRVPRGLDFWSGASYVLSVVAVDRETGLKSDVKTAKFKVAWANKAVDPSGSVSLTPIDTTVDDDHTQAVRIALTRPTGSRTSDVYDIYRMSGDAITLIGRSFPLSYTVTDKYAPFSNDGELHYRVALRTVDGDTDFVDVAYTLRCAEKFVRFDWRGGSLELPYGTSIGENYSKSVEFRQHMDGSVDGYWNDNIEHGASFNSSVIKLIQPKEIALARQLARYAGAVFVRTSEGGAFAADVQVTDLSVKNKAVTAIAIDATEVGITDEFMLPNPRES